MWVEGALDLWHPLHWHLVDPAGSDDDDDDDDDYDYDDDDDDTGDDNGTATNNTLTASQTKLDNPPSNL